MFNEDLARTLFLISSNRLADDLFIEVHAGHGLDYKTTKILSKIKQIKELNIGHYLIGESIFYGFKAVINNFKKILKKNK